MQRVPEISLRLHTPAVIKKKIYIYILNIEKNKILHDKVLANCRCGQKY